MYDSKLIAMLKVFDTQEKEALKKWVLSPVHNKHKTTTSLLLYLINKRKLTKRTVDRYKIFQHLYPNQPYEDKALRYLMRYSVQVLESFIEFSCQKRQQFFNKKELVRYLDSKGLNKYAQQHIDKIKKIQKEKVIQDRSYYDHQYQLEKVIFEQENKARRNRDTNLQAIFDNQYIAFVIGTLQYACEAIAHQRLYKSSYQIPLLNTLLEEIKEGKFDAVPTVQLYYYSYMSLCYHEDEHYFQTLELLLKKHHEIISPTELKNIYLTAINYCVQKLNNGIEKYVRTVFELYQYGLRHSILIENQILGRFTFKNIVTSGVRLGEYAWVTSFIKTYTTFLEEMYQHNYALYANAKLLFAQKKYNACMELLTQVEFDDVFLNMNAKVMLLKIYYEQEYTDALVALLASFKRFLQRKSIIAYQREIYENMIFFTEKLLSTPPSEKEKIVLLRKEVEGCNPLTEKPWLLAQLD